MKRLTLAELAMLPEGSKVVFPEAFDILPAGTTGTIKENGLSEIWSAMLILPDDPAIQEELPYWKGCVRIDGGEPGAESSHDTWTALSPVASG